MSDKYAELRRLAEASYAEGDWYDYKSVSEFPEYPVDRGYVVKAAPSTILSLLDELEACRKDAERYRKIRECGDKWHELAVYDWSGAIDPDELDNAVDAMQEQKP
jgi:hypothetical protein